LRAKRSGAVLSTQAKAAMAPPIAEAIKTKALHGGATIAVIAVEVFVGHIPIGVHRNISAETTQLLFNWLVLLWTNGAGRLHAACFIVYYISKWYI
jgi:hypothetical protein